MADKLPSETTAENKGMESRRSFLGKLGLGAAVLAAVSAVPFLKLGGNSSGRDARKGPGGDSIFQPREDQS